MPDSIGPSIEDTDGHPVADLRPAIGLGQAAGAFTGLDPGRDSRIGSGLGSGLGSNLHPGVDSGPSSGRGSRLGLGGRLRFAAAAALGGAVFLGWTLLGRLLASRFQGAERVAYCRRRVQRMFAWMLRSLERLGLVFVDARALDAIATDQPLILVPNHPSMLDAVVIISRLPAICCVMKRSLVRNPLTGTGARLAGYVDNGSVSAMVRQSVMALESGCQLLIFPEGTRSWRRPVGTFTRAFALIAHRSGIPMQTVLIESDSPYARKGWPLLRPPPRPVRYTVRLGRRFEPSDDIDGQVARMQAYFEAELDNVAPRQEG